MIGLLIITHEALGQAYTQLAEHFFNTVPENIRIMGIHQDDDPEDNIEQARELVAELGHLDGVLVLGDIFGATPCNTAQKLVQNPKTALLTGLNAPMMVKAVQYAAQRSDIRAFAAEVQQAAVNGIMLIDFEAAGVCRA
ncbi:PTS system ascorbate-specific IIA component [Neisseria sp. HSC-16F19]|nr:PTS mannose transporter subunit IIA [Neisseria sp. HSC-16F19]MCP2040538.1 PTS system ascorbate-specific IIA component [Neisseria sp. HSC-16F19]